MKILECKNNFKIKDGLLNNRKFIARVDDEVIRISKDDNEYDHYFKCVILTDDTIESDVLLIDELVYNKYTNCITFLNTHSIGSHIASQYILKSNESVSLYSLKEDEILVLFNFIKEGE